MNPRDEVLSLLQRHGILVRKNKHVIYQVNGHTVIVPTSPSDRRGWLNLRSVVRRALVTPFSCSSAAA